MNRVVFAAVCVFWAIVATYGVLFALESESDLLAQQVVQAPSVKRISLQELASHNSEQSCWLAIEGQVYDVTAYLPMHPAAPEVLLGWCGREASVGMRTKGDGRDHSRRAWEMLERYKIGELVQPG
ncbi:MAG: cytochrome b5-like heme/steroid binding domain-containing protein [Bdellovibrionota bacterium]|nr:MAG: cytochrome b5-like heme/steroid binding domain-containing protein [Bdellovibrionota bacterium]